MISKIKEGNLNTKGLINFIDDLPENQNTYFATHPRNDDRINILKNLSRNESVINSPEFNWIKPNMEIILRLVILINFL